MPRGVKKKKADDTLTHHKHRNTHNHKPTYTPKQQRNTMKHHTHTHTHNTQPPIYIKKKLPRNTLHHHNPNPYRQPYPTLTLHQTRTHIKFTSTCTFTQPRNTNTHLLSYPHVIQPPKIHEPPSHTAPLQHSHPYKRPYPSLTFFRTKTWKKDISGTPSVGRVSPNITSTGGPPYTIIFGKQPAVCLIRNLLQFARRFLIGYV